MLSVRFYCIAFIIIAPFTINAEECHKESVLKNFNKKFAFKHIVFWGHKLHSNSFSYIFWGFNKAFKHLEYDTLWLDNNDDISTIDLANSLFIVEGQVDQKIPIRQDCRYIIHNCEFQKYKQLADNGNVIILQVYTRDCLPRKVRKIDECVYIETSTRCVYFPWATDLLPDEIEENKKKIDLEKRSKSTEIYYIGTISGEGAFGNASEINLFKDACQQTGFTFIGSGLYTSFQAIDINDNMRLIQNCFMAPCIQGKWQCVNGYVPDRVFKNISYGQLCITNSKEVYDLFNHKVIYNPDPFQLFFDAYYHIQTMTLDEIYELMDIVKEKHTYLNRIEVLLEYLNEVKPIV